MALAGCHALAGTDQAPAGTLDPSIYNSADGATLLLIGSRGLFREVLNQFVVTSGTLTDELTDVTGTSLVDLRQIPERVNATEASSGDALYNSLQQLRVQSALTVSRLRTYSPDSTVDRAEAFAMQGYAEVLLADLYCSGIPLTMPRTDADVDYQPGLPDSGVYRHAVTLFDSAVALAASDTSVGTLARVGRGRALLALGEYAAAGDAVEDVQTGDRYRLLVVMGNGRRNGRVDSTDFGPYSVSDREGTSGLPYRSSADPRTPSLLVTVDVSVGQGGSGVVGRSYTTAYPLIYPSASGDSAAFEVATGIEARLIQAEAALRAGNVATWLEILNTLRTNGSFTTAVRTDPVTGDSVGVDTTWGLGTAAVAGQTVGLRPLVDPGTAVARVDTMFAERAAWLFLTGHREGDSRRMVRQYGRPQGQVYPSSGTNGQIYGTDVNLPIPPSERINPLFHGCIDRAP
jgi:hypothetical protein